MKEKVQYKYIRTTKKRGYPKLCINIEACGTESFWLQMSLNEKIPLPNFTPDFISALYKGRTFKIADGVALKLSEGGSRFKIKHRGKKYTFSAQNFRDRYNEALRALET